MAAKGQAKPPDGTTLRDGCRFSPSCMACPLPRCKHEMTASEIGKYQRRAQQERIIDAFARNRSAHPGTAEFWIEWMAARETGVTPRMVALARARVE